MDPQHQDGSLTERKLAESWLRTQRKWCQSDEQVSKSSLNRKWGWSHDHDLIKRLLLAQNWWSSTPGCCKCCYHISSPPQVATLANISWSPSWLLIKLAAPRQKLKIVQLFSITPSFVALQRDSAVKLLFAGNFAWKWVNVTHFGS